MKYRFFFVDDGLLVLSTVKSRYEKAGHAVDTATTGEDAITASSNNPEAYAAVFVDYKLPGISGEETIRALRELSPELTIVCLSGYGGDAEAVKSSWKAGACEFVDKGELAQLDRVIENACKKFDETSRILSEESDSSENARIIKSVGLIGKSEKLADVARKVLLYRNHRKNILIFGETGTGKKLVAEGLHTGPKNTFFEVNCADYADKPDLLRSELFGYVAGAFTDAKRDKPGIFELARGGTVFLDEIHEPSSTAQARIYLAVEEHRIKRVGGDKFFPIDVKIIAAAKPDLEQRAIAGTFRPDLFERLNVLNIDIPPLREHPEDIAPLVDFFCRQFCKENNQKKSFQMKTVNYFENYRP